jgi:hypothetical protein
MKNEISQLRLKELLNYNPDTGIFTWKKRDWLVGKQKTFNTKYAGKEAGNKSLISGYIQIQIDGKNQLAHRLAFLYIEGKFPEKHTDHINGIRMDNRWVNLRKATASENLQNIKKAHKSNLSTGLLGSHFNKIMKKFSSQIKTNGGLKRLGYFETAIEAHEAYIQAKRELHPFGEL